MQLSRRLHRTERPGGRQSGSIVRVAADFDGFEKQHDLAASNGEVM